MINFRTASALLMSEMFGSVNCVWSLSLTVIYYSGSVRIAVPVPSRSLSTRPDPTRPDPTRPDLSRPHLVDVLLLFEQLDGFEQVGSPQFCHGYAATPGSVYTVEDTRYHLAIRRKSGVISPVSSTRDISWRLQ